MGIENGADGPNWVESRPCQCGGGGNWTARHMERVVVKLCCGVQKEEQSVGKGTEEGGKAEKREKKKQLARQDTLTVPEQQPKLVRRRSINNWRPIAGIFSVSPKEDDLDECAKTHDDPECPHEAIHVVFGCEKCGHQFHCTYEIIDDEKGKRQSFGHYASLAEPITEGNCCSESHSYEFIQRIFQDMWDRDRFNSRHNNCRHWSDGFWWKAHPVEYKKKKAEAVQSIWRKQISVG